MKKKLPVGIENFKEFATENFYYMDKTGLIIDLINSWGKVNLFTRPRRFGKSLNMSMLQSFFEVDCDKSLFNGLNVTKEKELCDKYMGKFPVVAISLKDVDGLTFKDAYNSLCHVICKEVVRFQFLNNSVKLTSIDKKMYQSLIQVDARGVFTISDVIVKTSLQTLSLLLYKHYKQKVILLIDEYDVPLDKAFQAGYYDEMVSLIRSLYSNVLKGNESLYFAVLTGCLRISKESIFTGLNNLKVLSVTNARFDEYFGFTDKEVIELMKYYDILDKYNQVKEWYNGYLFGNTEIYCPWDVISHCDNLSADIDSPPSNYWANTSNNNIVRRFIDKSDKRTKDEIEQLLEGKAIVKEIYPELTYSELDKTIDNLWSVLFTTGYLTQHGRESENRYKLVIPNKEIRELFVHQIKEWFCEISARDTSKLNAFCEAFPEGDALLIERQFNEYLWNSISIRDTFVKKEYKENFYHGILLGLLQYKENWLVHSNTESGEGYSDILVEVPESRTGIVIEIKYAENGKLETRCAEALKQIERKKYTSYLINNGMQAIKTYGIACFKKYCKVMTMPHTPQHS